MGSWPIHMYTSINKWLCGREEGNILVYPKFKFCPLYFQVRKDWGIGGRRSDCLNVRLDSRNITSIIFFWSKKTNIYKYNYLKSFYLLSFTSYWWPNPGIKIPSIRHEGPLLAEGLLGALSKHWRFNSITAMLNRRVGDCSMFHR